MFWSFLVAVFLLRASDAVPAGVYVGQDGTVGASWGGYHASAGLGGILGGAGPRGGLHAQAGTPGGHYASAGLGGSVSEGSGPQGQLYSAAGQVQPTVIAQPVAVAPALAVPASSSAHSKASASASSGSGGVPVAVAPAPVAGSGSQASASSSASSGSGGVQGGVAPVYVNKRPGTFFDDIFNIPISTLGAVNQYLNNRQRVALVPAGVAQVQQPAKASQTNAFASSSASSSSSASASSDSGSSGVIDNNIYHGGVYHKNPNYNDIFNIPISVLGAVNRFLNG